VSAPEDWQFQVSPKLADGTLINVRARSAVEFAQNIELLKGCVPSMVSMMRTLSTELGRAGEDLMAAAVETVQQGMTGAQVVDGSNQYTCKHGSRVLRTNKPGSETKWTAYFCPTERGTPDQCPPVFVH